MKQILITSLTVLLLSSLALHSQEPQSTFQQAREEFNEGIRKGLDKQYQQALEHFEEALALNPLYAEAHLYCGISLIELEDYPQAIKKISIAMEIDP
ncbi:MAG: tetratricopeptide repeat protein, partial [Bacteroidales bacterium]